MGNLRDLKAFVRYDGSGRVVAGSLIFRKKKPTIGNFQQIQSYKCCNFDQSPVPITVQGEGYPFSYPDFVLQGDGGSNSFLFNYGQNDTVITDIYVLATALNAEFPSLGEFKVVDGNLFLNPTAAVAAFFAATGATSLLGFTFPD